ncbi:MAG: hypothetical protein P8R54_07315 [Myxococcota bacterium]|nr:hypothetical protein [Myxococcota bacterium]
MEEYVTASRNAITAGFDGIEVHAASGDLLNQLLNLRTDAQGGSAEAHNRFVIEVARRHR